MQNNQFPIKSHVDLEDNSNSKCSQQLEVRSEPKEWLFQKLLKTGCLGPIGME